MCLRSDRRWSGGLLRLHGLYTRRLAVHPMRRPKRPSGLLGIRHERRRMKQRYFGNRYIDKIRQ